MKCKLKKLYLLSVPFICVFGLLGLSKNANAANLGTSGLAFEAMLIGSNSYGWSNVLLYNQKLTGVQYMRRYNFTSANFITTGTNATIHFETNIVYSANNAPYADPWVNRDYQQILGCWENGTKSLEIIGSSLSMVSTIWYPQQGWTNDTLTVYGDIGLKGLTKNANVYIVCDVGSTNYAWGSFDRPSFSNSIYFEQNPMRIEMTDSNIDNLLQVQINQTNEMLNINNKILEQQRRNEQRIQELNGQIQQTQQNIQAIEDELTNPNVSGNFNTSPIQPFGPIGTITNSILELPRIILDVNSCSPLTPELPYIHENIEIPCPSTILNGMAGGFMTFLDTIASASIWFILARYIFKKVQKLRDPENTDEEYLDI